jgi:hypothetical protein
MEERHILMGPKLGDFLHSLVVPYFFYETWNIKTNLYINEIYDKFTTSLEETYNELHPIMMQQPYISSFQIYDPEKHNIEIDLNEFRWNGNVCTRSFSGQFLDMVFIGAKIVDRNFQVITLEPDYKYQEYLIVNRRGDCVWSDDTKEQYEHIFSQFEKRIFMGFNKTQYDNFPLKDQCEFVKVDSLLQYMRYLAGCNLVLCNTSATLAMSTVLNCPRIGEIEGIVTRHYANDYMMSDFCEFFGNGTIYCHEPKFILPRPKK